VPNHGRDRIETAKRDPVLSRADDYPWGLFAGRSESLSVGSGRVVDGVNGALDGSTPAKGSGVGNPLAEHHDEPRRVARDGARGSILVAGLTAAFIQGIQQNQDVPTEIASSVGWSLLPETRSSRTPISRPRSSRAE
jgi:hypothetical protein